MGSATDQDAQNSQRQDYQETMFEESTTFPKSAEAEPEQSYEAEQTDVADGLPDEAPDDDVISSSAADNSAAESPHTASPSDHHAGHVSVHAESPATSPDPLTVLTMDDFAALEERVLRAVNLVRRERQARQAAEERLLILESQILAQSPALEQLQQEVEGLRVEREQVRQRVERLLGQLDALEL